MILESEPDLLVVGEAGDGEKAIAEARALQPDVVLMDIRMPRLDGVEATRSITGTDRASAVKVLVLTTFDLDEYVVEALKAGASGFLLKDVPPEDLVQAIRVVADGESIVAPGVMRRLLDRFTQNLTTPNDKANALVARLTDREREVLRQVARGLSNSEIAGELFVSETTVKTHVGNLLAKLGLRDRVQAVVFAYESGLTRPGETG